MSTVKSFWRRLGGPALLLLAVASGSLEAAGRPDAYDLTIYKFKSDVGFEAGKKSAEELNAALKKQDGFEKRHLYFDKEQGVWIDQIKWKHVDAAKKGREALLKDATYKKLEEMMDKASVQRFRSERLFEVGS